MKRTNLALDEKLLEEATLVDTSAWIEIIRRLPVGMTARTTSLTGTTGRA